MIGRDIGSATRCEEVLAAATVALDKLANYGVTAAKLTSLQYKITAYRDILTKPREAKTSRKTTITNLAVEFEAATDLLNDRLDKLVRQFRANNGIFVSNYQDTRLIVKPGAGHRDPNSIAATKSPKPPST